MCRRAALRRAAPHRTAPHRTGKGYRYDTTRRFYSFDSRFNLLTERRKRYGREYILFIWNANATYGYHFFGESLLDGGIYAIYSIRSYAENEISSDFEFVLH